MKLSLIYFIDCAMKLGMQISLFGFRKDDQPKNQAVKSAPDTEQASYSNLGIDLKLHDLYR